MEGKSASSLNPEREQRLDCLFPRARCAMTNHKTKKTILLADDHQIVREGLRALLERRTDLEVIGETADGIQAVEFAKKYLPDIIVMDVTMPNLNGIEATRQIMAELEGVRIVALSMYFDR